MPPKLCDGSSKQHPPIHPLYCSTFYYSCGHKGLIALLDSGISLLLYLCRIQFVPSKYQIADRKKSGGLGFSILETDVKFQQEGETWSWSLWLGAPWRRRLIFPVPQKPTQGLTCDRHSVGVGWWMSWQFLKEGIHFSLFSGQGYKRREKGLGEGVEDCVAEPDILWKHNTYTEAWIVNNYSRNPSTTLTSGFPTQNNPLIGEPLVPHIFFLPPFESNPGLDKAYQFKHIKTVHPVKFEFQM